MDLYLKEMFADTERISQAIEKGVDKKMRYALLEQLSDPQFRAQWCLQIHKGEYHIEEPYMIGIDKPHTYDPVTRRPEQRKVVICSNIDRTFLTMANDITFERCAKDMVHHACMSYQKGVGCGKVVKRCISTITKTITKTNGHNVGVKLDLSKYFDSVPRWKIHETIDKVEEITGKSAVLEVIREFYDNDNIWDKTLDVPKDEQHVKRYQSLKQGVAFASFLADACLYDMDEGVSKFDVFYVRYSDDMLIIGPEWRKALKFVEKYLQTLDMKLNPKKVEILDDRKWFKFLGFNIRGESVTLSDNRLKTFKDKVRSATIGKVKKIGKGVPLKNILRSLYNELYGNANLPYSWASSVLPCINNEYDIRTLNGYIMSCIRAAHNGYTWVSGIGCDWQGKHGCIKRENDRFELVNRKEFGGDISGYNSLSNMRMLMIQDNDAFRMELREMYRSLQC